MNNMSRKLFKFYLWNVKTWNMIFHRKSLSVNFTFSWQMPSSFRSSMFKADEMGDRLLERGVQGAQASGTGPQSSFVWWTTFESRSDMGMLGLCSCKSHTTQPQTQQSGGPCLFGFSLRPEHSPETVGDHPDIDRQTLRWVNETLQAPSRSQRPLFTSPFLRQPHFKMALSVLSNSYFHLLCVSFSGRAFLTIWREFCVKGD